MNTMDAISSRFSCRNFTKETLTKDEKLKLIQAGLMSPTARNSQSIHFYWIDDQSKIDLISEVTISHLLPPSVMRLRERNSNSIYFGAPHVLLLYGKTSEYLEVDIGIATQSICLLATEMNIGTCINGLSKFAFFKEHDNNLRHMFDIEENQEVVLSIAIGRFQEAKAPHSYHFNHVKGIQF